MKIFRCITCCLLFFCVLFSLFIGNKKLNDYKDLSKNNDVEKILIIWHIDTFEGGVGSRKQFLSKIVRDFEKENKNILICVVEHTIESARDSFSKNIYPDIISYGNGLEINNVLELNIDKNFVGGKVYDKTLAIPWCRGGYVLIENPNFKGKTGGNICVVSQGEYTVPLFNILENNYEIQIENQFKAYLSFVNNNARYLLGSQRDIVRLTNRNMEVKITPLTYYNDLYQYVSILDTKKGNEHVARKFVEFLLSEKSQKQLKEISMFSCFYKLEYDNLMKNLEMDNIFNTISVFNTVEVLKELQRVSKLAYLKDDKSLQYLKKYVIKPWKNKKNIVKYKRRFMAKSLIEFYTIKDEIELNKDVSSMFSYKTGGKAFSFIDVISVKQLRDIIDYCDQTSMPYKIIGNGTNILLSDRGFNGLVIRLKKLNSIKLVDDKVKVMAGADLFSLIDFCIENSFSGVESLAGIPATIGGAITMNVSAFDKNISDYLLFVEILKDGKICKIDKQDCLFSYRKSRFLINRENIISATFKFPFLSKKNIINNRDKILLLRRQKQPSGRSCGSIFKNPPNLYAGKLIEDAHLKGFNIGGAYVSDKHANFIIAKDKCTSSDIYNLINYIKKTIYKKYNILLQEEIEFLGEFDDINKWLPYTYCVFSW